MTFIITSIGYFFRGVFTVFLAINVAIHWILLIAIVSGALYLSWTFIDPIFTLVVVAIPAFIGYRAWLSER